MHEKNNNTLDDSKLSTTVTLKETKPIERLQFVLRVRFSLLVHSCFAPRTPTWRSLISRHVTDRAFRFFFLLGHKITNPRSKLSFGSFSFAEHGAATEGARVVIHRPATREAKGPSGPCIVAGRSPPSLTQRKTEDLGSPKNTSTAMPGRLTHLHCLWTDR